MWVGVGGFSKLKITFNHIGGSFNLFMATIGDVWIIPSFWILDYVLHVKYVSCVITNCGNISESSLLLNSSLGFAWGKHYQKITIPKVFRFVLQNFAIPRSFPYVIFYRYLFSLISSVWFAQKRPLNWTTHSLTHFFRNITVSLCFICQTRFH